jgi:hypothetical protein
MRELRLLPILSLVLFGMAPPHTAADEKKTSDVPREVRALEGTYTGSWVMYGIDEQGDVVKKMAWTDTMAAAGAEIKGDRAQVKTTDEMMFEGGNAPPFKVEGKEGYFLKKDGTLGDYFIETFGQVNRLVKVGENVWSFTIPAFPQELTGLGFPKEAAGRHVVIKVVGKEQGVETHRISRLSTVTWTDKGGREHVSQFVSLQGYHKRQPQ